MKKHVIELSLCCALFAAACADTDRNAAASAEYVKAARSTEPAKQMFANSEFAQALAAFEKADAHMRAIAEKYPDSAIALKIVSEQNLMAGSFRRADLAEKIIPKLSIIARPNFKPFARALAAASFDDDPRAALAALYECVEADASVGAGTKAELAKALQIRVAAPLPAAAPAESAPAPAKAEAAQKYVDTKALLADARKNARYCALELKSAEQLLKKAELVDKKIRGEFSEILRLALARAEQISAVSLREKSFAILAAAAAKAGDEALAMQIISKIKNPEAFEKVFGEIAETIGKTENYPTALAIASKLKSQNTRDGFLRTLSSNVAKQGKFEPAIEIAKQISQIPERNAAVCDIAAHAYKTKNYKSFVAAITNIDVSNLDCARKFASLAGAPEAESALASSVAALAKITIPLHQKAGEYLAKISAEKYDGGMFAAELIVDNFLKLKKYAAAREFVNGAAAKKLSAGELFCLSAKTALGGLGADRPEALKALENLAFVSKSEDVKTRMRFAYDVEKSELSEAEKSAVLKPLLKIR